MRLVLLGLIAVCAAGCAGESAVEDGGVHHVGRSFMPRASDPAVVLECTVAAGGGMQDCVVLSETPAGQGFGDAALESAREARVRPNESGVGHKLTFTLRFRAEH